MSIRPVREIRVRSLFVVTSKQKMGITRHVQYSVDFERLSGDNGVVCRREFFTKVHIIRSDALVGYWCIALTRALTDATWMDAGNQKQTWCLYSRTMKRSK